MKCFHDNTPIEAQDALYDLFFRCGGEHVIVSAAVEMISIPDYLRDKKVLGSMHVQDVDDNMVGSTIFVVDDGREDGAAERIVAEILDVDSAGTGVYLKPTFGPGMEIRLVAEGPGYPEC